jgi:ABC-2 type transport system ATP-binding protein
MSEAVLLHNVTKRFGNEVNPLWKRFARLSSRSSALVDTYTRAPVVVAVDRVSFSIERGEIFGLLGPSGSGKSTLVHLLATLLLPDSGEMRVFNYDVVRQPVQVQRLINRVSVGASFFMKLSPIENLVQRSHASGLNGNAASQAADLLFRLGFTQGELHTPMQHMPREMQQKVSIARALLSRPQLLLLDEPTAGLDLRSRLQVHTLLRELRQDYGTTVLVTTGQSAEAETLCDRVALLEKGKLQSIEAPSAWNRATRQNRGSSFLDIARKPRVKEEMV